MRARLAHQLVPRQELEENLHFALWTSYVDAARPGQESLGPALEELRSRWSQVTRRGPGRGASARLRSEQLRLIVGTALWHLLDVYEKADPPKEFAELLANVLGVDLDQARELRGQPAYSVLPPLGNRLVSDSSFTAAADGAATSSASASLTVRLDRDFDEVQTAVDPTCWPERFPLFWTDMRRRGDAWEGGLRLPGTQPIDVTLRKMEVPPVDPTEARASFAIDYNARISSGNLSFHTVAEPSKPGWINILHERSITFSADLRESEVPMLAYWTKSEIACLALS